MNARTKLISLLVLLTTGFGFWVYCQTGTAQANVPGGSIAFCNPKKIFQAYKKAISMRADLIDEKERIMKKITDTQKKLKARSEELTLSGFLPQSKEYRRMRKDLVEMSIKNEIFAKVSQNELRLQDARINEVGFKDLVAAVQKVAENKGLGIVLQQVLYGDKTLDISAEVIEQLNTDYELGR